MKLYISISILLLAGCKSTPKYDHQMYITNIENKAINVLRKHKELGVKRGTEEPLQSINAKCIAESYVGQSVNVEGVNIVSSTSLHNMFSDYITYRVIDNVGFFMPIKQFSKNDYYMFKNVNFAKQVAQLEPSYKKVLNCLSNRGWDHYSEPKSKKS